MSTKRRTDSAPQSSRGKTRKSVNERSEYKSQLTERTSATKHERPDGYSPEAKAAMKQFSYQIIQGGLHSLRLKYAELKAFVPADPSKKVFDANQNKCRYKDVPCWDRTRVVLSWPPGVAGDFVHANRVSHELLEGQQFICCQGPLDATVADFWRCVWQEKVKQIIMLCRCEEMGKNKCAQYWPLQIGGTLNFHGLTIKCEKIDTSDRSFLHSKLSLTYENETRTVDHRQWTSWPDKSVPKTPMAPFRLLQHTRKYPQNPTVIHCSAGVGRTGTLVMIEIMYRSLTKGKIPDVAQLVKDARSQRSQAVQTEDQYLYCHYAILQLLHIKKVAPSHFVRHFIREYENYLKLLNDVGGKNLPMQATSLPQPCANCSKVAAHMNDAKGGDSPPSESKMDSKKAKDDSNKRMKEDSKREAASKKEEKHVERKANLLKQLKTQKEEKEKRGGKIRTSGEPFGTPPQPSPTVADQTKELPHLAPDVTNQTCDPNEDLKPVENPAQNQIANNENNNNQQTQEKGNQIQQQQQSVPQVSPSPAPAQPEGQQQVQNQAAPQLQSPPPSSPAPQQQQQKSPPPPSSSPAPPAATQQQQQQNPASSDPAPVQSSAPLPQQQQQLPEKSQSGPQKFQYKPALTYTVQQAGKDKAIVYHRNTNQPFIKALASPAGTPQPVCLVQPPNQPQQQPPQPQQQNPPNQPGVPPSQQKL